MQICSLFSSTLFALSLIGNLNGAGLLLLELLSSMSSLMLVVPCQGAREGRLLLLLLLVRACLPMSVYKGTDAALSASALLPSFPSPSPSSPMDLTTSRSPHLLVGTLGFAVTCDCSLPPLMTWVPRRCMSMLALSLSSLSVMSDRVRLAV